MEKSLFEQIGGTYTQVGDYLLPDLSLATRRRTPHRRVGTAARTISEATPQILFYSLLTSGKLNAYLAEIDRQAEDMFSRLVKQTAECEGVTEQLKAENQMEWVRRMNNIRNRSAEIINHELILIIVKSATGKKLVADFALYQTKIFFKKAF